jgi:myo-inositol-1(or 4)-monophosphatase
LTPAELVAGLARAVRAVVAPALGTGREVTGLAKSGDQTFALDLLAERATLDYLAASGAPAALYSEDGGLVGDPAAPWLLVVDPIDGTRPAKAGLESCCVSVALAPNRPDATIGDVTHAAVYELRADRLFTAERGGGTRIVEPGRTYGPTPSSRTELAGASLVIETAGRPIVPTARVVESIFDACSLPGGAFMFASSTFALTRLVTGQLELYLDVADRIRRDCPRLEPLARRAGQGELIALCAYDIAGVVLVAQEAGLTVTDAYGCSLADTPLTDVSPAAQRSCIAAATPQLHAAALAAVERGVAHLTQGD